MKKTVYFITVLFLILQIGSVYVSADGIEVSAEAAVLICADTNDIIMSRNAYSKLPMASTTKIMTALILAEQPDLSKTVTVTKEMATVEGSSMGLLPGDKVTYNDLLYGMLLASGNDAANTTAIVLGSNVKNFVRMMNEKARRIGLKNTSFETPSGLDGDMHYTTAYDLAVLASYALQNNKFRDACSSSSATLCYGNPPYKRTLSNHNRLLQSYNGAIGVKTGFTKKAGRCLVSAAEREGLRIIAVTLHDPDDWNDHKRLLNYGFEKVKKVVFDNSEINKEVPVICSDCDLVCARTESAEFTVTEQNEKKLTKSVNVKPFVFSPISAGETVGTVNYYFDGKMICSKPIFALADVYRINRKSDFFVRFKQNIYKLLCSI